MADDPNPLKVQNERDSQISRFLKLSKRVIYALDEIESYEHGALYESSWQKANVLILPANTK
jgi:hypothetical protein